MLQLNCWTHRSFAAMLARVACLALLVAAASCATLPENLHLTAEAPLLEVAAAKVSLRHV